MKEKNKKGRIRNINIYVMMKKKEKNTHLLRKARRRRLIWGLERKGGRLVNGKEKE